MLVAALAALLLGGWLSTRISEPVEARIGDMERRIAIGDLARQVNHDVKNGLAPLRNVFRHLTQVARDKPGELPQVFTERQRTVESSINYLETLAANYAKLSPQSERKATDVNVVVRESIGDSSAVKARLADGLPPVFNRGLGVSWSMAENERDNEDSDSRDLHQWKSQPQQYAEHVPNKILSKHPQKTLSNALRVKPQAHAAS